MSTTRKRITDKRRLDWLESMGDGSGWVARPSTCGRGYRLHNVTGMAYKGRRTVRAAIDAAMLAERQRREKV